MHDILGIGFGPSNLALAVCIREHNEKLRNGHAPLTSLFFERQAEFHWHQDMLIDDATMQVSYLKDLVTLRNPTSRFSFVNYLKQHDRLEDFINLRTFYPTRHEYADYLRWVADQHAAQVRHACTVERVTPGAMRNGVRCIEVAVRHGATQELSHHTTQNLVVATGLQPRLPAGIAESAHVSHSSRYLSMVARFDRQRAHRFLVVGGGQSAAEIVNHLHDHFPHSEVCAVFPTFGFKPVDDSSFVNQIFDPRAVDLFYNASEDLKAFLLDRHADTNYSVVDASLISEIYRKAYEGRVRNRQRLFLRRLSRLEGLRTEGSRVIAAIRDSEARLVAEQCFDAAILATGYRPSSLEELVPAVADFADLDLSGEVALNRHYSIRTSTNLGGRIYLQGKSEGQHGLTSTLLSALPIRAMEITQDILERRAQQGAAPNTRGLPHAA
jgi:L-ornithine N5-oxygenase